MSYTSWSFCLFFSFFVCRQQLLKSRASDERKKSQRRLGEKYKIYIPTHYFITRSSSYYIIIDDEWLTDINQYIFILCIYFYFNFHTYIGTITEYYTAGTSVYTIGTANKFIPLSRQLLQYGQTLQIEGFDNICV